MRENRRIRKAALATVVGATAAIAVAAPAMATTVNVGGGTWSYGVSFGINYSDYYHPSNNHRSSVISSGILYRSPCTSPGYTSDAWAYASVSGNQAFWNNAC